MNRDVAANGRPFTVVIEKGYTNATTIAMRILNEAGNVVVCIMGDGSITSKTMNFTGLPTSIDGLSSGDLWNDSGTLKIA